MKSKFVVKNMTYVLLLLKIIDLLVLGYAYQLSSQYFASKPGYDSGYTGNN